MLRLRKAALFHHRIHIEIVIRAPAARIWQVLTDFASFPDWNPFIRRAEGQLRTGGKLEIHIQPGTSKGMTFRPTLLAVDPERELRWLGRLGIPGVFDGEHRFELEARPDGSCLFRHREEFRGLLVPLLRKSLDHDTKPGFEAMNRALKARAEGV